jgi:hypothetical protein
MCQHQSTQPESTISSVPPNRVNLPSELLHLLLADGNPPSSTSLNPPSTEGIDEHRVDQTLPDSSVEHCEAD